MLERMKLVLINQKEMELSKKQSIKDQIDQLITEQKNLDLSKIDSKLSNIEKQIHSIEASLIKRIFNAKLLKQRYQEYIDISRTKMEKFNYYNQQIDQLLQELHDLVHDEFLIEKEIGKIKSATTLEELGLTEKQAQALLNKVDSSENYTAIQKVYSSILSTNLTTRDEISKITRKLHQTNSSAYVMEMQHIKPIDLMNQLLEIGIIIDEDKVRFLNELHNYIQLSLKDKMPNIQIIKRTDRLDNYYCNEVELALNNMIRYQNPSSIAVSQIKTLSILVSMAKQNKKEKTHQK